MQRRKGKGEGPKGTVLGSSKLNGVKGMNPVLIEVDEIRKRLKKNANKGKRPRSGERRFRLIELPFLARLCDLEQAAASSQKLSLTPCLQQ